MTHVTIVASPTASVASEVDLTWRDESACAATATALAQALRAGLEGGASMVIELHGTLGAGKTTFTRHLLRALGVSGRIKSPSYAVVEPHEAPGVQAWHFDFYRFNDPREWEDAGFRDLFSAPGLKLCEWADKARAVLPVPDLRLVIAPQDDEARQVQAQAFTPRGVQLLEAAR